MEQSCLAQHLNEIVDTLCDLQDEVSSYGEDSQAR